MNGEESPVEFKTDDELKGARRACLRTGRAGL